MNSHASYQVARVAAVLGCFAISLWCVDTTAAEPQTESQAELAREIDALVERLDHDDFAAREKATEALGELGVAALPRLRAKLENENRPEVKQRLERVLAKFFLRSTFDDDFNGWTAQGGEAKHAREKKSSGHIQIVDGEANNIHVIAPKKFLGDKSRFDGGVLSFDAREVEAPGGRPWEAFGTVTIVGAGRAVQLDIAPQAAPVDWTTFSVPLVARLWRVEEEVWQKVLADVQSITVDLESSDPAVETVAFDNFTLTVESRWLDRESFNAADTNGDALLNADEFPKPLRRFWRLADADGDGWVSRDEAGLE